MWEGVPITVPHTLRQLMKPYANIYNDTYSKSFECSKISNIFPVLFSNKTVGYQGWNSQNVVRIANRDDPDQMTSSEAV